MKRVFLILCAFCSITSLAQVMSASGRFPQVANWDNKQKAMFINAEKPMFGELSVIGGNLQFTPEEGWGAFWPIGSVSYSVSYELVEAYEMNLYVLTIKCKSIQGCIENFSPYEEMAKFYWKGDEGKSEIKLVLSDSKERADRILKALNQITAPSS